MCGEEEVPVPHLGCVEEQYDNEGIFWVVSGHRQSVADMAACKRSP